jgi:NAD(P)-dependent dehydrogenase (short-subunit alcohol dehydrogenase family)
MTREWHAQPDVRQDRTVQTLLGRLAQPEDIAWGILYLASDESGYVTGSELVIDGGVTAR